MFGGLFKRVAPGKSRYRGAPGVKLVEVSCYDAYRRHQQEHCETALERGAFEKSLLAGHSTEFTFNGYCYVCRRQVAFFVDFEYSHKVDGILIPNWRERLLCPGCHLNNRMRAVVQIFDQQCRPKRQSRIYITEQMTALYQWLKQAFPHLRGSEYLGNTVGYGNCNEAGIRNEDITQLSFNDAHLDYILSFDVFEHIPHYKKALGECYRCLKPGGVLYFSVPFVRTSEKNIVRAYISDVGEVIHVLPPEYHGDPLRPDGCLCYYHFGWELLDELKTVGFEEVKALLYWSRELGYLGGEQLVFMATKRGLLRSYFGNFFA